MRRKNGTKNTDIASEAGVNFPERISMDAG
jgi:hypothetical protein